MKKLATALRQQAKAPKQRRIEIEGRVWYIDLPSAPVHALSRSTAFKRGKRRAKAKARTAKHQVVQICKKAFSDPWDVKKYLADLERSRQPPISWFPIIMTDEELAKSKVTIRNFTAGLLEVQPMFRHVPQLPILASLKEKFQEHPRQLYYSNSKETTNGSVHH